MAGSTITVTDANFEETVLRSSMPVLLSFWADWSGPSKQMAPHLEAIASERDDIVVAKLNIDENPATAATYGVTSIPTVHVYRHGEIMKTISGAQGKASLERNIAGFVI
ncbi:thioredoxin family protein [Streptomyces sp. NPDC102473]|uniref:thioredoxin family protein n=1 Tax=Streptomyces sp. NPDC102473 TaxID=3366180 RepID=UPI00380FED1D